jgi:hypothetical protein
MLTSSQWELLIFLLLLTMLLMQGAAIIELKKATSRLSRSIQSLTGPRIFWPQERSPLPELSGIGASDAEPAHWPQWFDEGSGLVVVLDPQNEDCWRVGVEIGHYQRQWTDRPMILLISGEAPDAIRFVKKAKLPGELSVLIGDWDAFAHRVMPYVMAVADGAAIASAQFFQMPQLREFENTVFREVMVETSDVEGGRGDLSTSGRSEEVLT